jgi:hypothetical protein
MSVGKPNHNAGSGNFKKLKRFYLKEGSARYRILPPHGRLATRGLYFQYHRSHWGFKISVNGKLIGIPFECQREINFRTKEVERDCLICTEKVDPLENQYKAKEAEFIQAGLNKDQLREAMKPFNEQRMRYNREGKYYYNVLNEAGEIGVLGIPAKAKKALDAQIKKCLQEYHFDPIDADGGCWFVFTKEGKGGQTFHSVEIAQEMETITLQDGSFRQVPSIKRCSLTAEIIGRMDDEAGDLTDLFPKLTDEDQRRLLDSGGDPEVYKAILDRARPAERETYSNGIPKTEPAPKADETNDWPAWDHAQATPPVDPKVAALKALGLNDAQIQAILGVTAAPAVPVIPAPTTTPIAAPPEASAPVPGPAVDAVKQALMDHAKGQAPAVAAPKPAAPPAPEVDPEEAKLLAELAALKAKKAAQATAKPTPPPAPAKAPVVHDDPEEFGEISDEEWAMRAYGNIAGDGNEVSF